MTLSLDYGACTSVVWESRYSFVAVDQYEILDKEFTNKKKIKLTSGKCFRVKGISGEASLYSDEVCVKVETIHKPMWFDDKANRYVTSGDTFYVCDKEEDASFIYAPYFLENVKERYFSEWFLDGVKVNDDYSTIFPLVDKDCKITNITTSKNDVCPPVVFDFNYKVTKTPTVDIQVSAPVICDKSEVTIDISYDSKPEKIVWWQSQEDIVRNNGIADFLKTTVSPTKNTTYWLEACNIDCCSQSDTVTIVVKDKIELDAINIKQEICKGDEVNALVTVNKGNPDEFIWRKDGEILSLSPELHDIPEKNTEYTIEVSDEDCGVVEAQTYRVNVHDSQLDVEDVTVCEGSSVTLHAKGNGIFRWYTDSDKSNLLATGNELNVNPIESTDYYVVAIDGECEVGETVNVNVNSVPIIQDHTILGDSSSYMLYVQGGTGNLHFDFGDGFGPTESNIITNVNLSKDYHITVTDELGCSSTYVIEGLRLNIDVPVYFYPEKEKWQIRNLEYFNEVRIDIYNRFGKLIFSTNDSSIGWDGTYKGNNMPSADYWFVLKIKDIDQDFSGHFTLLRE